MKIIYYYDTKTFEYMGQETVDDYYQHPFNVTLTPIPTYENSEIPVWNGEFWEIEEDHRGEYVYSKESGEEVKVDWIGEINNTYTYEKPENIEIQYWHEITQNWEYKTEWLEENINNKIQKYLRESDWTQLLDSPITQEEQKEWAEYRRKLRLVKYQETYPYAVQWPEEPKE